MLGGHSLSQSRRVCRGRRDARLGRLLTLLVLLLLPMPARSAEQRVESPYMVAARNADVPPDLLIAIAGAESGYHPWALNIKGHQVFCQSREEAENVLANTPTDDVDIGLMQINWRF